VSDDDWWEVSSERVSQCVDRAQASIKRLDDNKAQAEKATQLNRDGIAR
jgi:hypothetical protein